MEISYQVQIDGLNGGWNALTPEAPHGPCDAPHLGDYWHTTEPAAEEHAKKVAYKEPKRSVRIVRRNDDNSITVVAQIG
jgi:hypothetical protein